MSRKLMILSLFTALFSCGDGKPGLFSSSGYHIGQDKIWYKTSNGTWFTVKEVLEADPATFKIQTLQSTIYPDARAEYGIDKTGVFWAGVKIEGADPASIEYLCNEYSRDTKMAYFGSQSITSDLQHFSVVNRDFVKDSKAVYFGNDVFSDDPDHFIPVGAEESGYFKDRQTCWYGIYPLKNADPATFRFVGPKTSADARRMYYEMNEIEGADLKTYQIIDEEYASDARQVYLKGEAFTGADPNSFRVLSEHFSADKNACYYYLTPVEHADPKTFQVLEGSYTKDAARVYLLGKQIEGADPATFRILNAAAGCSCDAQHVYAMEHLIKGFDPKSLPAGAVCKSCNESGVQF